MKRWIHATTDDDAGTFSWNRWFYTKRPDKRSQSGYKYLKSRNVRFDEFGDTQEVSFDEYTDAADKYYEMFGH